jgi:hypothetical protein
MLMKMKLTAILIFLSLLLGISDVIAANQSEDFAFKISLENHLEKRLKYIITEITGSDRSVVIVNADIGSVRDNKSNRGSIKKKKSQDALILPGVPVKKEFGAGQSEIAELLFPGAGGGKYKVNKIYLTVWLDKGISTSVKELIRDLAKQVIGYQETRGDQVNIQQIDFSQKKFYWSSIFYPKNLGMVILGVIVAVFFITAALFLRNPFNKLSSALANVPWDEIRGESAGIQAYSPSYELQDSYTDAASSEVGAIDKGGETPFSFIEEQDLPNLEFLLKERPAEDVATLVNYLDIDLGAKLLESFPADKQAQVALHLSSEKINPEGVRKLESEIKEQLSFVIGGERKFVSLLRMSGEDVRNKVMNYIEGKDKDTASRLRNKVKSFEATIQGLPAEGIQILYRRINPMMIAQILKSSSGAVQDKFMGSLSEGAAERLRQEIELSPPLSQKRLRKEKIGLMLLLNSLIDEGTIEGASN